MSSMLDLLRSLEWYSEHPRDGTPLCPVCRRARPTEGDPSKGHAPGCRLDRAIRELTAGKGFLGAEDEELYRIRFEAGRARYRAGEHRESNPCVGDTARKAWFAGWDAEQHEQASRIAREPTVDEMAREMGLDRDHGGFYGRMVNGEVVEAYAPKDIPPLYREHKARQLDATLAGKRVGPWLTPPAPKVYEASGPPTDPSALAAWLYARVVPGQTRAVAGSEEFVVLTKATHRTGGFTVAGARAEPASYPAHAMRRPITRLLNPDGTVLWEAK